MYDEDDVEAVPAPIKQGQLDLGEPQAINPFMATLTIPMGDRRFAIDGEADLKVVDTTTGVIEGSAEIVRRVPVDRERFTKVFSAQLGLFFGLSQAGIRLLAALWIEVSKRPGEDRVYMTPKTAERHAERAGHTLSRATYFRGRSNLIEVGFIAPSTDQHVYWINPAVFFNGDRVRFVTEIRRPPALARPGKDFDDGAE